MPPHPPLSRRGRGEITFDNTSGFHRRKEMSEPQPKLADALALERTRMAADRTLMGWIRTALSMISFGFTIFKFLEYVQEQSITPLRRAHGPREVGITLIGIGIFA